MLDYEILKYEVQYFIKGAKSFSKRRFYQEEKAIHFIKERRDGWQTYRLLKYETAIIDF